MSQTQHAAVVEPDPGLSLAEIWAPISEYKNKLVQEDYGLAPKAVIALDEEWQGVGDRISLYWGEGATVPDVEYELTVSDLYRREAGFEVPWPSIEAAGKGDIAVWYMVTPDDTDTPARTSGRSLVTVETVARPVESDTDVDTEAD
ncbi:hypothetical protein [Streptomyces sp. NPDC047974]|uniref:hypothetical protein n=1 Tax=Streptomyces sp. NPDC047974 TaxID=3154343 RepID=UPI0033CA3E4C